VGKGEAVGLIGGNGSGKSTLLKMIAGVLLPDEGSVRVRGGVAPLIELTGGFIGELSARENIFLTAGLHGMSKNQVEERFDEIVDFAGQQVRDALDTPFRHFSSGMQVRLGFAVITTLDEPIVLVDEVLAVGDRAFREKCYVRMEDMLSGGKTLFLVSHSEADLKRFAQRGLYLQQGKLVGDGPIDDVIEQYNADVDATT
jgi:ABC-2 type transport system ATP-binding protein